jgi:hypothetical protein
METSKDIKGQGAKRAFFGINMGKNENPSKQNDILVVVKVTLIYFLCVILMMASAIHSNVRNLGLFFIDDKVGISK